MSNMRTAAALAVTLALSLVACGSTTPQTESDRRELDADCRAAVEKFQESDPSMKEWFETAQGYAVFPNVGKAGIGLGGAHGRGQVYEKGRHVGYSTLTQATIGLQLGAQGYSEVVFFKDEAALKTFQRGEFELSAQASAVAATAGASADADYSGGVAIFTMAKGGLMYEASVGGQKFDYEAR